MTTDTSEKGLETLIMRHMTGTDGLAVTPNRVAEPPAHYGGTGYTAGSAKDTLAELATEMLGDAGDLGETEAEENGVAVEVHP